MTDDNLERERQEWADECARHLQQLERERQEWADGIARRLLREQPELARKLDRERKDGKS
jgi:hypothetical protein